MLQMDEEPRFIAKPNRMIPPEQAPDIDEAPQTEGKVGHLNVFIEFESLAAAKAADEAPEYQKMLKLLQPHCNVSLSIIEECNHSLIRAASEAISSTTSQGDQGCDRSFAELSLIAAASISGPTSRPAATYTNGGSPFSAPLMGDALKTSLPPPQHWLGRYQ